MLFLTDNLMMSGIVLHGIVQYIRHKFRQSKINLPKRCCHLKKVATILTALFITSLSIIHLQAQPLKKMAAFTHADTLRGTYGPSRDWWDVLKYDLHVKFNIVDSTISGYNVMQYKVLKVNDSKMQIDLQSGLTIDTYCY